jgi:hypothetical protein
MRAAEVLDPHPRVWTALIEEADRFGPEMRSAPVVNPPPVGSQVAQIGVRDVFSIPELVRDLEEVAPERVFALG